MGDTTAGIDPRDLRVSDHLSLDEFGLHIKRDDCDEQVCRRVIVIDPEDRAVAERLNAEQDKAYTAHGRQESVIVRPMDVDVMQDALRALAEPPTPTKPYREHSLSAEPWPQIPECHSRHVGGHECPQCAWEHEHDWVAWTCPGLGRAFSGQTPIRCSKCGGRKCDLDLCPQQRHTHTHDGSS